MKKQIQARQKVTELPLKREDESHVEKMVARERAQAERTHKNRRSMSAFLVSLECPDRNGDEVQSSLQELKALVSTLGDNCLGQSIQKRSQIHPATYIGAGKAAEIHTCCQTLNADYVIVDAELSASQSRNLEKIIQVPVIDRTNIILEIFQRNAKTREAKVQVEIATLEYLAPRLSNSWIAYERQRTGSGGGNRLKGAGEKQIELDRRRIRQRVTFLKKSLEQIQKERIIQRKRRQDHISIVLVGYTNAGKTSVMNALTGSQLVARDALFETLDSSVRILKGAMSPRILVTDTVGFIRNLPHRLVASFRSSLEEAAQADLLLHVVDSSRSDYQQHIEVTNSVLAEIGAGEVPQLIIFNKSDLIPPTDKLQLTLLKNHPNSLLLAANHPEDMTKLKQHLFEHFATTRIPNDNT